MTGKQLRAAIESLGFVKQIGDYEFTDSKGFAQALGLGANGYRTVNRWIAGKHETPRAVEILLDLLCRGKITLEDLR